MAGRRREAGSEYACTCDDEIFKNLQKCPQACMHPSCYTMSYRAKDSRSTIDILMQRDWILRSFSKQPSYRDSMVCFLNLEKGGKLGQGMRMGSPSLEDDGNNDASGDNLGCVSFILLEALLVSFLILSEAVLVCVWRRLLTCLSLSCVACLPFA